MQNNGLFKELLTLSSVWHSLARRVGLKRLISSVVMLNDVPASSVLTTLNSALFNSNDTDAFYGFTAWPCRQSRHSNFNQLQAIASLE